MDTSQIGIVPASKEALSAVLGAISLADKTDPVPIQLPQGKEGGCVCCQHKIAAHFNSQGQWIGCTGAEADTVLILVPANMLAGSVPARRAKQSHSDGIAHDMAVTGATAATPAEGGQTRGARRYRYFTKLHHKSDPAKLELSETRLKVLKAVHAEGKTGTLAKQVMKKTKLPHGSIQQTLNWLRAQGHIDARPVEEVKKAAA